MATLEYRMRSHCKKRELEEVWSSSLEHDKQTVGLATEDLSLPDLWSAGRRVIHRKEFKQFEKRHPRIPELNSWIKSGSWDRAVKDHNHSLV